MTISPVLAGAGLNLIFVVSHLPAPGGAGWTQEPDLIYETTIHRDSGVYLCPLIRHRMRPFNVTLPITTRLSRGDRWHTGREKPNSPRCKIALAAGARRHRDPRRTVKEVFLCKI